MTTFLVMQTRIADELVRDDLASQTRNAINDAIKTWEGIRLTFNERRYLINTVADTEYYDLTNTAVLFFEDGSSVGTGGTLLEIDDIRITVNSSWYSLSPRTDAWFSRNSGPAAAYTGQPDSYGVFGNILRLFPIPDAVYPLSLAGLGRLSPVPLSADADTNPWMVEGETLIRQQAKYILYRDLLRDAEGKANAAEGVQEAQYHLERKYAGRGYTGRQKAWTL